MHGCPSSFFCLLNPSAAPNADVWSTHFIPSFSFKMLYIFLGECLSKYRPLVRQCIQECQVSKEDMHCHTTITTGDLAESVCVPSLSMK